MTTPHRTLDAPGMACVDLTPLIAKTMRDLEPGEVFAVHTDDPAARVGVPAWCRLTRNRLVQTSADDARPRVSTPVNWKQGEDVIIAGSVSNDEAREIWPDGWEEPKPYIRIVPQP